MWSAIKKIIMFLLALTLALLIVGLPLYWFLWKDNPSLNPFIREERAQRPLAQDNANVAQRQQNPSASATISPQNSAVSISRSTVEPVANSANINIPTNTQPDKLNTNSSLNSDAVLNKEAQTPNNNTTANVNNDGSTKDLSNDSKLNQPSEVSVPPADLTLNKSSSNKTSVLSNVAELKIPTETLNTPTSVGNNTANNQVNLLTQDSVVGMGFIEDLAKTLVNNYRPQGTHPSAKDSGVILIDVRYLNTRYAGGQKGLAWQGDSGNLQLMRSNILNYVLSPSMLNALTELYKEPLIQAIDAQANNVQFKTSGNKVKARALSPAELEELYKLYAVQMRANANLLRAFVANPSLAQKQKEFLQSQRNTSELQTKYMLAAQELYAQNPQAVQSDKLEALNNEYQKAVAEQGRIKQELLQTAKSLSKVSRSLNDDNILYTLAWAERRNQQDAIKNNALKIAADSLTQVAKRFEQEANK